MKKKLISWIFAVLIIAGIGSIPVPTKQGIDYKLYTYNIPLFIKAIEFIDRDYNYRRIVSGITKDMSDDQERVLAIFRWCTLNIKHKPEGLPIVDDHPLNIIIRGYASGDQFEDIFTILCTYAGYEAFYKEFHDQSKGHYILSFVKIGKEWYPFSVSRDATTLYQARLVSCEELSFKREGMSQFIERIPTFNPDTFLEMIKTTSFKATTMRVRGQSPAGRLSTLIKGYFN